MNYIWEIVLRAQPSGMQRDQLFFQQAADYSPWYEQAFPCINQRLLEVPTVEMNGLYRFAPIFQKLLHQDLQGAEEFKKYLFDLAVHLLCEIDLQQGLTKRTFYLRKLEQEVLKGVYGEEAQYGFSTFSSDQKNRLAALMLNQLQTGSSLLLFKKAILILYPKALLYQLIQMPKQLLVYVAEAETPIRIQRLKWIQDMFLPIDHSLRIFWEHHFGVLAVDATLELDEIELF